MSSELALASVTALLKRELENGLVALGATKHLGSDVTVSALPPDRITTGSDERAQINLFLYQVDPNVSFRSAAPAAGRPRASVPAGFDLKYLLTAYGSRDLEAELVLGYALRIFRDTPMLDRERVRAALETLSSNGNGKVSSPVLASFGTQGLAERVSDITIGQVFPGMEEFSRLWSALQARMRPSALFKVSVVVFDAQEQPA